MSGLGQRMTIKRKTRKAPAKRAALAQAIARHMAAQAALDAIPGPQDHPEHRCDEEDGALDELAFTPCASDAEFLEKLRYLYAQQAKIWDLPEWRQLRLYRHRRRISLLSGERMTLRLRYLTLKLRALCWVLRRLRAVLMRLSYLSPEIVRAILIGQQPVELTPTRLVMLSRNLPHDWQEQRRLLGFAPA